MSDHDGFAESDRPSDAVHASVRDALPALLHGRVSASDRVALDRHLASCASCSAELHLLASVRERFAAAAPTIATDQIAAAVLARTIRPTATASAPRVVDAIEPASLAVLDTPARPPLAPARPRGVSAWTRRRPIRALAATALLAVGTGALYLQQRDILTPAIARPGAVSQVASAERLPTARPVSRPGDLDASSSLLGASFADLTDAELAAVVDAVADPNATVPAAEPTSVSPTVFAADAR